ncbi:hypothetical protein GCM10009851_08940 [Herbiconiux moechotypicola]|uniref:Uncharacterized protein n=2 Tax=Herbiconiux moechotypicola TaxID=637393 RepID=A0ABP5Q648_9MICO
MLLAACSYTDYDKLAVRAVGDELQIAVCADFKSSGISVSISREGSTATTVGGYWNAGHDAELTKGDVLSPSRYPEEWVSYATPFTPTPGMVIEVTIWDRDENYMEPPMRAAFLSADVPVDSSTWLLSDGSLSDVPCP